MYQRKVLTSLESDSVNVYFEQNLELTHYLMNIQIVKRTHSVHCTRYKEEKM